LIGIDDNVSKMLPTDTAVPTFLVIFRSLGAFTSFYRQPNDVLNGAPSEREAWALAVATVRIDG